VSKEDEEIPPMPQASTAFAFKEISPMSPPKGNKLTEGEREDMWNALLEKSERAGGTLTVALDQLDGPSLDSDEDAAQDWCYLKNGVKWHCWSGYLCMLISPGSCFISVYLYFTIINRVHIVNELVLQEKIEIKIRDIGETFLEFQNRFLGLDSHESEQVFQVDPSPSTFVHELFGGTVQHVEDVLVLPYQRLDVIYNTISDDHRHAMKCAPYLDCPLALINIFSRSKRDE
jgi:hypothetical protein